MHNLFIVDEHMKIIFLWLVLLAETIFFVHVKVVSISFDYIVCKQKFFKI